MPLQRPQPTEHAPHHQQYLSLVSGPVLDALHAQKRSLPQFLAGVSEADADHRYAPGKWSIREVVGHISDAERIYQFRALAFARGDAAAMPRYDPDGYVEQAGFDRRTMGSLIDEFLAVRESTLQFFAGLDAAAWDRKGTVANAPLSVRALAFIAAGHAQRHLNVLAERYGVVAPGA